jgi:signal transduction histidine kinase
VDRFLALATSAAQDRVETASGMPLGVAAFAEARRLDPRARLSPAWFAAVRALTFVQPSSLTPWVLGEGSLLAQRERSDAAIRRIGELQVRWLMAERLRALAARLQDRVRLMSGIVTNVWLNHGGDSWFAAVQPAVAWSMTGTNGHIVTNAVAQTSVRFVSLREMGLVFHNASLAGPILNGIEQRDPPRLPYGMKLSFALLGLPLPLPASTWATNYDQPEATVLAEVGEEFRQEGQMMGSAGTFDNWPSRPRFTVRVHLTDPAALFAAQRRQQWFFAGMIAFTAGIAGIGGWQTNRAFRRQLALNEQKSDFVSSVSHELRAPLASMRLLAEGLADGRVQDETKRKEYAGFLVQETRRLGALVENVLDFAGIEQGCKRYDFGPTDVVALVRETVKLVEPLAAERGVRTEALIDDGSTPVAFWDGRAIQRALLNLLDNSLKHSPKGSVVTVRLESSPADRVGLPEAGTTVRIAVTDRGPGIPPEDHARIFERFVRRGSELRRETQGVGLGLAIVKHIAEAHGGRVRVASVPGEGAMFTMELPASPGERSGQ